MAKQQIQVPLMVLVPQELRKQVDAKRKTTGQNLKFVVEQALRLWLEHTDGMKPQTEK
jgi:hypothetical protein